MRVKQHRQWLPKRRLKFKPRPTRARQSIRNTLRPSFPDCLVLSLEPWDCDGQNPKCPFVDEQKTEQVGW